MSLVCEGGSTCFYVLPPPPSSFLRPSSFVFRLSIYVVTTILHTEARKSLQNAQ